MEVVSDWSKLSEELVSEPDNFQKWEQLIQLAERGSSSSSSISNWRKEKNINKLFSEGDLEIMRLTYGSLLSRFPLLHQYWLNFAEWEFRLGNTVRANDIYLEAISQLPYSIEVWTSYVRFKVVTTVDNLEDVIRTFEKGRECIGLHFYAHEFYELYLSFLREHSSSDKDMAQKYYVLLRIVIEIPMYHFGKFFNQFINIIEKSDEVAQFIPRRERHDLKLVGSGKNVTSKLKKIFTDSYITTQHKVYQLYQYEKNINRPYFHVTYLSESELTNWDQYLDFLEINHFPLELIKLTYERCLVATALYPKFWIRYANYFIANGKKIENAKQILVRGISCVQQTDYLLKLKLCDLEIFQGQFIKARDIVLTNLRLQPTSIPHMTKLVQIERLMNPGDDEYLLQLIEKLTLLDGGDLLIREVLLYDIDLSSSDKVVNFFKRLQDNFASSFNYWDTYMEYNTLAKCEDADKILDQAKRALDDSLGERFLKKWSKKGTKEVEFSRIYEESLQAFE
ncbi:hypothetical protein CLIB1423_12S01442 [[Candida] railenensis]|uniref:Uncharacterized protein n=1 Tax=[Candida] railenensis TaxID=45579 RepID=A0A9P0QSS6_9ASCO|nr:hypothetical protein CLIB1423_12S01442 [[Candida] railenensis]